MFSYEGDTVLDPFLGSGTTIKVARELRREAIGYEREEQYKSVIMKRLGIEEQSKTAGTMTQYAQTSMDSEKLEESLAQGEATVTSRAFETQEATPETETVG